MKETILYLLEKITRTRIKLENMKKEHNINCLVEADPDYYGPCTCGSAEFNEKIYNILSELEIKSEKVKIE